MYGVSTIRVHTLVCQKAACWGLTGDCRAICYSKRIEMRFSAKRVPVHPEDELGVLVEDLRVECRPSPRVRGEEVTFAQEDDETVSQVLGGEVAARRQRRESCSHPVRRVQLVDPCRIMDCALFSWSMRQRHSSCLSISSAGRGRRIGG